VSPIFLQVNPIQRNFIVIEGNIGAGKTSLVKRITADYSARAIYERFEDNPFLPKFYENKERYSFPLELSFLADRYDQLKKELSSFDLFSDFIISDYYFMKSLIFASRTLQEDEYKLYKQLFTIIYQQVPKPDLYVYLHASVGRLASNIELRGRDYEKLIQPSYLESIQQAYFEYFKQQNQFKLLILDINHIDFVNNSSDYKKITDHIFLQDYPVGTTRVIL
jgi:deoxyguanosine kinase